VTVKKEGDPLSWSLPTRVMVPLPTAIHVAPSTASSNLVTVQVSFPSITWKLPNHAGSPK
jgi:hypothetical protein